MTDDVAGAAGSSPPHVRVLAVMPGLTPEAGAETSLAAVTPLLASLDVELHLAVLTPVQQLVPAMRESGVVVHDLSVARGVVGRVCALRRLVREVRPDLVHATLFDAAVPSQLAAVLTHRPVLVTWASTPMPAGENPQVGRVKRAGVRAVEAVLARLTRTRFHAVTSGVARTMAADLRVPAARVRVAERGRDATRFTPLPATSLAVLRHDLHLAPTDRVLLAVGRQDHMKAHARLLDAFASVLSSHPDAVLLIAGREGSATSVLRARHGAMADPDRVRFLGHRDDVPALLQVAEAAVCSSVREGAAGALVEAMASGTPIVTTRLDGLEDVLVDHVNALVVEADALAAALCETLDDPDGASRRAAQAGDDFARRFTVEQAAVSLAGVYRWAAGLDARRAPIHVEQVLWRLSRGGGVQTVVRNLIAALDPQRVRLTVVTARPRLDADGLDELPVPVLGMSGRTGALGPRDRAAVACRVARHVLRARPDVLHLHSGTLWLGAIAALVRPRARVVVEVHDAPGSGRHGARTDLVEGWFARWRRATVVCHSRSVAAAVSGRWCIAESRIVTFPLSVDARLFRLEPSSRHAARRSFGLDHDAVVLLGVGRVVASKQFHRVVAALPGDGATFLLVGDGPELERVRALARTLGVEDRLLAVGPRYGDDLAAAYAAADVLVSPSAYEGFGLTLVEGMAAGLPVVADAVGGVTDIVVDGETGLLLAPGDDDALCAALAAVVADPDRRVRMGAAGRRRALALFTPETFAESFTAVYERGVRR